MLYCTTFKTLSPFVRVLFLPFRIYSFPPILLQSYKWPHWFPFSITLPPFPTTTPPIQDPNIEYQQKIRNSTKPCIKWVTASNHHRRRLTNHHLLPRDVPSHIRPPTLASIKNDLHSNDLSPFDEAFLDLLRTWCTYQQSQRQTSKHSTCIITRFPGLILRRLIGSSIPSLNYVKDLHHSSTILFMGRSRLAYRAKHKGTLSENSRKQISAAHKEKQQEIFEQNVNYK